MGSSPSKGSTLPRKGQKAQSQIQINDFIESKGKKFAQVYIIEEEKPLGRGSFGLVRKVRHRISQRQFAVKIIEKIKLKDDNFQQTLQEIEIMKQLDHPNIVKILEYFDEDKQLYIIMEYCSGGALLDEKEIKLSEKSLQILSKKLLSAINYTHQKNIVEINKKKNIFQQVHKDIKPENILFSSQNDKSDIKIIDWGLSCYNTPKFQNRVLAGTKAYMSPEIFENKFSIKGDIWAIGVTLYELIAKQHPFFTVNMSDQELYDKIKKNCIFFYLKKIALIEVEFKEEIWKKIPKAKEFIGQLLRKEEKLRPSAEQALKQNWLKSVNENQLLEVKPLMKQQMTNLFQYKMLNKIQKTTWAILTTFFVQDDIIKEAKNGFLSLDKNNDGTLSPQEIKEGYKFYLNADKPEKEFKNLIEAMDLNKNGKIDYSEFILAAAKREQAISEENLIQAFKMLDLDKNDYISLKEMKQFFQGSNIPENVWTEIFSELDKDGNNNISFPEFKENVLQIVQKLKTK